MTHKHRSMRRVFAAVLVAAAAVGAQSAQALESDQLPDSFNLTVKHAGPGLNNSAAGGVLGKQTSGAVLGVDSLPNWSSYFYFPGVVPNAFGAFPQFSWQYTMVGRSPVGSRDHGDYDDGLVTRIHAPIIPVIIDLRNSDGSPRYFTRADGTQVRMILDPTEYIQNVVNSPVFVPAAYSSSYRKTQLNDAIQRAEFYATAGGGWHTLLVPDVRPARTMVLIRGTYSWSADPVTGKLRYVLVNDGVFASLLFPPTPDDTATVVGSAEHSGDMKTTDLTTFLFANTFLFSASDGSCCILGYHTYDMEPGDATNGWRERHYVLNYSSWISPGLFGAGFQDITALSHELAETFNDPFVNNATPIWLAPNGLCQNNLETGDVIEGLPNATFPMTMNGFTYHPQNEALLQWFAGITPSSAVGGAYSYPDPSVLTSASTSLFADCATPFVYPAKH